MANLTDRPNYRVRWSEADLAQLATSVTRGDTIRDIAQAMGRSQEAVRNRATSADLMKKRVIGSRSRAFREMAEAQAYSLSPIDPNHCDSTSANLPNGT